MLRSGTDSNINLLRNMRKEKSDIYPIPVDPFVWRGNGSRPKSRRVIITSRLVGSLGETFSVLVARVIGPYVEGKLAEVGVFSVLASSISSIDHSLPVVQAAAQSTNHQLFMSTEA